MKTKLLIQPHQLAAMISDFIWRFGTGQGVALSPDQMRAAAAFAINHVPLTPSQQLEFIAGIGMEFVSAPMGGTVLAFKA